MNQVRLRAVIVVVVCVAWAALPIEGGEDERLRQVERVLNEGRHMTPEDFKRLGSALCAERDPENQTAIERILREHTPAILASALEVLQLRTISWETRRMVVRVAEAVGPPAEVLVRPFLRGEYPDVDEEAVADLARATFEASSARAVIKGIREDVSSGLTTPGVALRFLHGWSENMPIDAATLRVGLRWCLRPGVCSEDWCNLLSLTGSSNAASTPDSEAIIVAALGSLHPEVRQVALHKLRWWHHIPESVRGAANGLMFDPAPLVAEEATQVALDINPECALRVGLASGRERVVVACIQHLALEGSPKTARELSDLISDSLNGVVLDKSIVPSEPLEAISIAAVRASATNDPWGIWAAPLSLTLYPGGESAGRLYLAWTLQHWGSRPEARGIVVSLLKDPRALVRYLAAASLLLGLDEMPPAQARSLAELGLASQDSLVSFVCGMWVWKSTPFDPHVHATVSAGAAALSSEDLRYLYLHAGVSWQARPRASALRSFARAINEHIASKGLKPIQPLIRLASPNGE